MVKILHDNSISCNYGQNCYMVFGFHVKMVKIHDNLISCKNSQNITW